jgi:DNA invertase Pin-like site-specific DNA recombinase
MSLATFAAMERQIVAERVRAGMVRAKKRASAYVGWLRMISGEWSDPKARIRRFRGG